MPIIKYSTFSILLSALDKGIRTTDRQVEKIDVCNENNGEACIKRKIGLPLSEKWQSEKQSLKSESNKSPYFFKP